MLLKNFFNNISQLQPLGMQSLAGEAGVAQTDVERLFAQCPIMRNGNPGLILPPARQRVDLRSEPSCFGQRRPRSIECSPVGRTDRWVRRKWLRTAADGPQSGKSGMLRDRQSSVDGRRECARTGQKIPTDCASLRP